MRQRILLGLILIGISTLWFPARHTSAGDNWLPIDPADLKLTSEPKAPGAPAICLYRKVDRKDSGRNTHTEFNYVRIKILTEEGRKHGIVEIPFSTGVTGISGIHARTIHTDGKVIDFDGKVYESTIVKTKTLKYLAKTFSLPDVQVGSIIEYQFMYDFDDYHIFFSNWQISGDLFLKKGDFILRPYEMYPVQWNWPAGLPEGTKPPEMGPDHIIRMTSTDVPAFQREDYMPPENELRFRVDFVYSPDGFEKDSEHFWKKYGKKQFDKTEGFADKKKEMEQAVSQIVSPSDSTDAKLRKIYARCQQVKNLNFERKDVLAKEQQVKNNNVEDVWKNGVGVGREINLLFMALVRAAGFEAHYVQLSARSEYFFNEKRMNAGQLDADAVLVKADGKDLFLDPATKFAPYGLLPWPETGVTGLSLDKNAGTWVKTQIPDSSACKVIRQADLKLTEDGGLEGRVTVTYTGLEALWARLHERFADDTERKDFLEEQLKNVIPVTAEVELKNKPDWDTSDEKFVAEYDVKIPGWLTAAGRRAVLPLGVFGGEQKHMFEHSQRTYPIYFSFPFETVDQSKITLPAGWKLDSVPNETHVDAKAAEYRIHAEGKQSELQVTRTLRNDLLLLEASYYPTLHRFYQQVRSGDEQQAILLPGASSASN